MVNQANTEKQNVDALHVLTNSPAFKQLCKVPSTNLIPMVYGGVGENDLTTIMASLCDPRRNGTVANHLVVAWLGSLLNLDSRKRYEVTVERNWRTVRGRYLDMLIDVRASVPSRRWVVGIEAKIEASESDDQIQDYQRAIASRFKEANIRKLAFLTPDGREPQTGEAHNDKECPWIVVTYASFSTACRKVLKTREKHLGECEKLLLAHTATYIEEHLGGAMTKSQKLIKDLYTNPEMRRGIDQILLGQYRPTMRTLVYEKLLPAIRKNWRAESVEVVWHFPQKAVSPREFNMRGDHMPKGLYYMLYSATPGVSGSVDKGDAVQMLIMGYNNRAYPDLCMTSSVKKAVTQWQNEYPEISTEDRREWGPWTGAWAGEKYTLSDLGDEDCDALLKLYGEARMAFRKFDNWAKRK
jgi:hypothetical protein